MIWHNVRFDFTGVDEDTRTSVEAALSGLADLDVVAFLRLGRDLDEPGFTGFITGFASYADLETYRTHPDHLPVVDAVRAAGVTGVRFDIETDDRVEDLP